MDLEEWNERFDRWASDFLRRWEAREEMSPDQRHALFQEGKEVGVQFLDELDPGDRDRWFRTMEDESPADAAYALQLYERRF
jgi:hypothetical protein